MQQKETAGRLLKYSATAAALTGVSVANGQIFYTDPNPDIQLSGNFATFRVDVDQNGTDDFEFIVIDTSFSGIPYGKIQVAGLNAGDDIIGFVANGYSYASLLSQNDVIDGSLPQNNGGVLAEFPLFGAAYPLWNDGVTDGYLGFKIELNGSAHYGWMRLDVASNAKSAVLKDMAVNLSGGDPIQAGQSLGIADDLMFKVNIFQAQDEMVLQFPAHLLNGQVEVLDMTGKIIASKSINNTEIRLNWSMNAKGLFIVRMRYQGTVVARKQIMR